MKLYCISNQLNSKRKVRLTIGEWYEVISQKHFEVILKNDAGKKSIILCF